LKAPAHKAFFVAYIAAGGCQTAKCGQINSRLSCFYRDRQTEKQPKSAETAYFSCIFGIRSIKNCPRLRSGREQFPEACEDALKA